MVTLTANNGTLTIDGEKTVYVTAMNGDFDVRSDVFFIQDNVSKKETWIGPYTNVSGFASKAELVTFLSDFFSGESNPTSIADKNGDYIDIQNPLPTDGDAVYKKDIWAEESDTTGWIDLDGTGENVAYIPFTNLHTAIENSTADAEKVLFIHFNRTVQSDYVGLGCAKNPGKTFSNVKVELVGSGGTVRTVVDDSANNTKYTSNKYDFEPQAFNAIQLTFATTDTITLTNIIIFKAVNTSTFIKGQDKDGILQIAKVTQNGNLKISVDEHELTDPLPVVLDGLMFDSFGNVMTSEQNRRFDVEFTHDLQPLLMNQNTTGGGETITFNSATRDVSLKLNATTNGLKSEFIQKFNNPYTPGSAQIIEITGTPDKSGINTMSAEFYLRNNGTSTDYAIPETRNWDNSHIFAFDFQSLKVGTIRYWIVESGVFVSFGKINNNNLRAHGYWQYPALPIVWRTYNTATETITEFGYDDGTNGIGYRFRQPLNASVESIAICGTVKSGSGGDLFNIPGFPFSADMGVSPITVSNTLIPVISIRANTVFKGLPHVGLIIPTEFSLETDNGIYFQFLLNATLTGESWSSVDPDSATEYDISATAYTGGTKVYSDYLATGTKNTTAGENGLLNRAVLSGANGSNDILTIVAIRTTTTDANVLAKIGVKEIR